MHDAASTVHALALLSPFLKTLPLDQFGLQFAHPDAPFAHPLDDGTAVVVERSIDATANALAAATAARTRSCSRRSSRIRDDADGGAARPVQRSVTRS